MVTPQGSWSNNLFSVIGGFRCLLSPWWIWKETLSPFWKCLVIHTSGLPLFTYRNHRYLFFSWMLCLASGGFGGFFLFLPSSKALAILHSFRWEFAQALLVLLLVLSTSRVSFWRALYTLGQTNSQIWGQEIIFYPSHIGKGCGGSCLFVCLLVFCFLVFLSNVMHGSLRIVWAYTNQTNSLNWTLKCVRGFIKLLLIQQSCSLFEFSSQMCLL